MEATTGITLSSSEKRELAEREAAIEAGLTTFVEVGDHLLRIRDARLYRDEFDSFDAYCRERWDFGERRAEQLFAAASVVRELESEIPNHGSEKPHSGAENGEIPNHGSVSERVARELAKAPAGTRKEVLEEAKAASNGKPTAKAVQKVVARRKAESEPSAPDAPPWAAFNAEVEQIISRARTLANDLAGLLECDATTKKPKSKWAFYLPYDSTVGQLRSVIRNLEQHVPAAPIDKHPYFKPVWKVAEEKRRA